MSKRSERSNIIEKLAILLFVVFVVGDLEAQKTNDAYGKPIIVLTEQNPWLMAIGSDTPTFALYETGQVIYKHIDGKTRTIYEAKLEPEQLKKFVGSLSLDEAFYKLPEQIEASNWTDQPTNVLRINLAKPKQIFIYGNLRMPTKNLDKAVPEEFMSAFNKIINYTNDSAIVWSPKIMEVMFWDFSYAKEKIPWPKTLPDLNSATTEKFKNGMYSVYLTADQFDEFKKFSASIGEKTAIEISGKKMTLSARYPFPNIR